MRKQTLQELYELHRKVNPKEVLIGWYSTLTGRGSGGAEPVVDDDFTAVVHDFFSDVAGPAMRSQGLIHLLVDVSLATPHINVFAYRPISNALLKKCVQCVPPPRAVLPPPHTTLPHNASPPFTPHTFTPAHPGWPW